jgi:hypothetical protein
MDTLKIGVSEIRMSQIHRPLSTHVIIGEANYSKQVGDDDGEQDRRCEGTYIRDLARNMKYCIVSVWIS